MRWKLLFLLAVIGILSYLPVSALEKGVCITAEITSVNPSSIDADEDFTVGIEIDNCGESLPKNITFEITRYSPDIEIKESLITYIGEIGYSNSKRFLTYHMHSSPDAAPGEHSFETKLTYNNAELSITKDYYFSVTINAQEPDLAVSRIYTDPEVTYAGENMVLTIDVENAGNGNAKDVRIEVESLELAGVKKKYLGKIESGENSPARFVLETEKEGIYGGNISLEYKSGGQIKELSFPFDIQVFSKKTDYRLYVLGAILIAGVLGYFLLRKKS